MRSVFRLCRSQMSVAKALTRMIKSPGRGDIDEKRKTRSEKRKTKGEKRISAVPNQ